MGTPHHIHEYMPHKVRAPHGSRASCGAPTVRRASQSVLVRARVWRVCALANRWCREKRGAIAQWHRI